MATNDVTMLDDQNDNIETQQQIPQSLPLDTTQVPNSAGGYVWPVSDMRRLRRFLCLGSEGGTYYAQEKKLGITYLFLIGVDTSRVCESMVLY